MTDYKSKRAGFGSDLPVAEETDEPARIGFRAVLKEPEEVEADTESATAPSSPLLDTSRIPGLARILAAGLTVASLTVAALPEESGRLAGHFAGGFNMAAKGNTVCQISAEDCTVLRAAGEAVGNILYKFEKGFEETSTAVPGTTGYNR